MPLVGRYAFVVRCRDASDDKGFVDINVATDRIDNFKSHTKPLRTKNTETQPPKDKFTGSGVPLIRA